MIVFGHRGAPGSPRKGENTLVSFRKALAAGASAIEFDVRRAKDGALVVIHDADVARTTNGKGAVASMDDAALAALDAGGDKIPLLNEVLDAFGAATLMNIELKEKGVGVNVKKAMLERGLAGSVIISAFDADDNDADNGSDNCSSWSELAAMRPELPIGLLAQASKIARMGEDAYVAEAVRLGAAAIHPESEAATPSLVAKAHAAGLKVNVWTVNDLAEEKRLRAMGVDGIFSDLPERFC